MAKKKHNSYLIVDGYNIINDWEELKSLASEDLDAARERLIHYIIEYAQYNGKKAIIVFDAYNVKNSREKVERRKYITIVYTKEHQNADSYIEKFISTLVKIKEKQRDNTRKIQRNFLEDRLDNITLSKLENIRRKH